MNEIRMDRRGFLKGLLAVSVAATVLPALPSMAAEAAPFVIIAPTIKSGPTTGTMLRQMGRLGRIRIDSTWLSLDDAWITMTRKHVRPIYEPGLMPGQYRVVSQDHSLVNSPWQVQIWTPESKAHSFFGSQKELEFEIDARHASFVGNGFVIAMATEVTRAGSALFSLALEGDEKLRRFGEVRAEDLEL